MAKPDPLFPGETDASRFDTICGWLREWFNVLPLDAAVRKLREGTLPARAAAITFDDGYADNHDIALPILQRHGLTATFFIATGFLDGGRMWNDTVIEAIRRTPQQSLSTQGLLNNAPPQLDLSSTSCRCEAIQLLIAEAKYLPAIERASLVDRLAQRCAAVLPADLMMRPRQIVSLKRAGMTIGAHTVTHPILSRLSLEDARSEIAASRSDLQDILGERIGLFAYPNGKPGQDYRAEHVALVRDLGFDAAVSTAWGASRAPFDMFQLRRFTPWDLRASRFGLRLARNMLDESESLEPQERQKTAINHRA